MSRIAFRADASLQIGNGHVMRCLTLADQLRERGDKCSFVCRPHKGHLLELIAQRGHQIVALPALEEGKNPNTNGTAHAHWLGTDWTSDVADTQKVLRANMGSKPVDWLVVDHYGLEMHWEKAMRAQSQRIMVIDDLADRHHECDLLLDQNLGREEQDYEGLLKSNTTTLIGPKYALLRSEFAALRGQSLQRRAANPTLKHLLITMGGVDNDNATGQMLEALKTCSLPSELRITVVMGPHAPWLGEIKAQASRLPWRTEVLAGVNNMAQLIAQSDLAIGAAGSTSWERCCLGLPTLMVVLAKNQTAAACRLKEVGAAVVLTLGQDLSTQLADFIVDISSTGSCLPLMSECASKITDGNGCTRVFEHLKRIEKQ